MRDPAGRPGIPSPAERAALNAALFATDTETGFWDDHGRPAPWPDDIEDWAPITVTCDSAESPEWIRAADHQ